MKKIARRNFLKLVGVSASNPNFAVTSYRIGIGNRFVGLSFAQRRNIRF